jgi:hypothetical protein
MKIRIKMVAVLYFMEVASATDFRSFFLVKGERKIRPEPMPRLQISKGG